MIPLRQVVSGFDTRFEDEIIQRLDRKPTITVHADAVSGPPSALFNRIRAKVEALDFGPDYDLAWWGEARDSKRAQNGIKQSLPFWFLGMVLIVIALFNALRQPLLPDAFFVAMAVTIIAGLMVATVLTMIVVPVLYAIFFRVPYDKTQLEFQPLPAEAPA
jgi:multidrug efflux pump subunit AcrB